MKGLPPCFLYLSGPQYKKLGPDIVKWQYHQVINIKTGLKMSSSFSQPFSRQQEVTKAESRNLVPECCYRGLEPTRFPKAFFLSL